MNLKCKVLCALLCMTALFGAVSSEAAVSVRGKNLDDIEDIISTATDGNANLPKYSLGIMRYMGDKTIREPGTTVTQTKRGDMFISQVSGDAAAGSAQYEARLSSDYADGSSFAGMYAAASSLSKLRVQAHH